jgi:rfaE bifunctional protein nucleotidyltransferase chain/domain
MDTANKIVMLENLSGGLDKARKAGKKIVFTNGCFDILHVGHVRYLTAARSEGHLLVVGLNSDISVRLIKGAQRPIVGQDHRAEILAALACVDYVILFDEPDPLKLIQKLIPDVLVKGEDWVEDAIVGAEFVKSKGGKIVRMPFEEKTSTSDIIQKILQQCRGD